MDTRKKMRVYLKGLKSSLGYIPERYIYNAYGVKLGKDYTNIRHCINDIRSAISKKSILKFS